MATRRNRTLYDVLELQSSASKNDIKDAYKRMALRYHPDKNPNNVRAVAMFQETSLKISDAYDTLYDEKKRMHYNIKIGASRAGQPAVPMSTAQHYRYATNPPRQEFPPAHFHYKSPPPDSFWSGKGPSVNQPSQESVREESEREEAKEKRKVDRQEKKRQVKADDITKRLGVTLSTIARLRAELEKAKAEKRAADTVIGDPETEIDKENESAFWETVFERNVAPNTLKREYSIKLNEYRKLTRSLEKVDAEGGKEAREIYRQLRKEQTKHDAKPANDSPADGEGFGISNEEQSQVGSEEDQNALSSSPDKTEQYGAGWDNPVDEERSQEIMSDYNIGSDGLDPTDEAIHSVAKEAHAKHEAVDGEFWTVAEDCHICSFCRRHCAYLQCPRWDLCGVWACEHCKSSY